MEEPKLKKRKRKGGNDGLATRFKEREMAKMRKRHGLLINEERVRHCLRCDFPFMSEGHTNRMCSGCSKYTSGQ